MTLIELAHKLRHYIEKASFFLDDVDALESVELFPMWKAAGEYSENDRVRYDGVLYRCLTSHTANATWTPTDAPSLWTKVLIPDANVIPEWEQPLSTNPYMKGDKVSYMGKNYESTIDNNVWSPDTYGWREI